MTRKIFIVILFILFTSATSSVVIAKGVTGPCDPTDNKDNHDCNTGLFCEPIAGATAVQGECQNRKSVIGGCNPTLQDPGCKTGLFCEPIAGATAVQGECQNQKIEQVFGKIAAPSPLAEFLAKNPTGGSAISQFLSNGITLAYSVAGIILIFMIIWGAFEWMTSGGDKEKLAGAQKRIISAIIGILLFAVAFAVIQILGNFTGFTFFNGS